MCRKLGKRKSNTIPMKSFKDRLGRPVERLYSYKMLVSHTALMGKLWSEQCRTADSRILPIKLKRFRKLESYWLRSHSG